MPRFTGTLSDRINQLIDEVAELREEVYGLKRERRLLQDQIHKIENWLGSEVSKVVIEQVGYDLGRRLQEEIMKAVRSSGIKRPDDPVTVTVPADALRFSDGRLLERQILAEYVDRAVPRLKLRAFEDAANATITTYHYVRTC